MFLDKIALILAIVGALNWGGIGLFGFDTVAFLFGGQLSLLARIIYALVGLAGLWCITLLFRKGHQKAHIQKDELVYSEKSLSTTSQHRSRLCGRYLLSTPAHP